MIPVCVNGSHHLVFSVELEKIISRWLSTLESTRRKFLQLQSTSFQLYKTFKTKKVYNHYYYKT